MKKIYTEKYGCADCGKLIYETSKESRMRVIKSWIAICMGCFRKYRKYETQNEKTNRERKNKI